MTANTDVTIEPGYRKQVFRASSKRHGSEAFTIQASLDYHDDSPVRDIFIEVGPDGFGAFDAESIQQLIDFLQEQIKTPESKKVTETTAIITRIFGDIMHVNVDEAISWLDAGDTVSIIGTSYNEATENGRAYAPHARVGDRVKVVLRDSIIMLVGRV